MARILYIMLIVSFEISPGFYLVNFCLSELAGSLTDANGSRVYVAFDRINDLTLFVNHCGQVFKDGVDVNNVRLENQFDLIAAQTGTVKIGLQSEFLKFCIFKSLTSSWRMDFSLSCKAAMFSSSCRSIWVLLWPKAGPEEPSPPPSISIRFWPGPGSMAAQRENCESVHYLMELTPWGNQWLPGLGLLAKIQWIIE